MIPPTTILHAHDIPNTLDYLSILIFFKYTINHEIIMALIALVIEYASTGRATPGIHHTVRKFTFLG